MPEWPENHTPISAIVSGIAYYDREIKKAEDRLSELLDWVEKKRQELGGLRFQQAAWVDAKNRLGGDPFSASW